MSFTIHLTPFEEQLLQLMYDPKRLSRIVWYKDTTLASRGQSRYSWSWAGNSRSTTLPSYPLIGRFLGRLKNKGLVQDQANEFGCNLWSLSKAGRELLGLPPVE